MHLKRWTWAAALVAAVLVPMALGAQQPKRELLLVYEDHVKPSMVAPYEASTKELIKALADAKAASSSFEMMTLMYDDFTYVYLTPLKDYSALDGMENDWMAIGEKVGKERWKQIMASGASTMNGYSQMIAEHLPAISYAPAAPRLKEAEMGYVVDDYYYVLPGKTDEFKALGKQFADLYRSKGITNGWDLYQAVFGEDMPFYVVGHGAKNPSDFAEWDQKDTAALGEEGTALFTKVLSLCRRIECRPGWMRPDLSYHVPAPESPKPEPPKKK